VCCGRIEVKTKAWERGGKWGIKKKKIKEKGQKIQKGVPRGGETTVLF